MQKWEYLFQSHSEARSGKGWTRMNADPFSASSQTVAAFFNDCNRLGSEGWELVGLAYEEQTYLLAFKRPKE